MKVRNRDTGVRGSVASAPWEEDAHVVTPSREVKSDEIQRRRTTRRSVRGRRETSGPPEKLRGALFSVGVPLHESGGEDLGTHEVRVHAVRLGGRRRLDASRVFFVGRSQDLSTQEGASREEVRSIT